MKAIAAMAENRVIGAEGRVPWHLPEDLQWFKARTLGQVLVMGRKTYESIGQPLPGRSTVVLSRTKREFPGVQVVSDWGQIKLLSGDREVYLCGGGEVYAQGLPRCSDLYLTCVKRVALGDTLFPPFEKEFQLLETILDRPEFRILHFRRRSRA